MRLFIAFELPENIKDILRSCQAKLELTNATPVRDFHLTLKFLGEVPESKLSLLVSALQKVKFTPFDISLSGTGVFPNESYIKVVWVGSDPLDRIVSLQKEIDAVCHGLGFAKEHDFRPHLTLARIKFIPDKKLLMKKVRSLEVPKESFKADSFKLIKSTLQGAKGPLYETLETFGST